MSNEDFYLDKDAATKLSVACGRLLTQYNLLHVGLLP
ncbi:hypothetical protein ABH922_003476 [Rhodococcus sp. 27YEA15]